MNVLNRGIFSLAEADPNQNRQFAALCQRKPEIFNGVRHSLADLLSISRTYASLQKYDVTLTALNAIAELTTDYLQLRDGNLLMPSSLNAMFGTTPFEFDPFLTDAMEGISSLSAQAVGRTDTQLAKQVVAILEQLGVQSCDIRVLGCAPGENPTTGFIQGYLNGTVQAAALHQMDDVTMAGANALSSIGKKLIANRQHITAMSTIEDLEKLAYVAIEQRKSHVIGEPVRGLTEILWAAVTQPVSEGNPVDAVLNSLQRVCQAELSFKSVPGDFLGLRFSLGPFLSLTQRTALAYAVGLAVDNVRIEVRNGQSASLNNRLRAISQLISHLSETFAEIGKAAAVTESFALHDINANIGEIAHACLWLYDLLARKVPTIIGEEAVGEASIKRIADALLRELESLVDGTYSQIFEVLPPPVRSTLVREFFPTLSAIGIRALDFGAQSVAEAAISELKAISLMSIEKPLQGGIRSAPRVAAFIARIGMVAEKMGEQGVAETAVAALKEFGSRFLKKQIEMRPAANSYEIALATELDDLVRERRESHWLLDKEDVVFFSRVSTLDIEAYSERLYPPSTPEKPA